MTTRFDISSRTCRRILAAVIALSTLLAAVPLQAGDVSQEDFNALKELVRKQEERTQKLEENVRKLEKVHEEDAGIHKKDVERIQQLQDKLEAVQLTTGAQGTNAQRQVVVAEVNAPQIPRAPIDEATVNHNFMIVGDAEFQYAKTSGQNGTFLLADFAPIFLYRGGDNILFEAGFDFVLQNNAPNSAGYNTSLNLSFAQLDYLMNDYMTLSAGNIFLPLGVYSERSAGWLNKFPDDPLARDLVSGSGVGAELRGSFPLSEGKNINYSVYGVNGPSSADYTGNAGALDLGGNVGLRTDNAVANLHGDPSGGGRVGFFYPFKPHYDFDIGLSGQYGEWIGHHMFNKMDAPGHVWTSGVIDASLHLGSYIEAKGEYIRSWYGSDDFGTVQPQGWWAQVGYKLAGLGLELPGINNIETVGRYDFIRDGLGTHTQRYSLGLIYYVYNTLLVEADYEFFHSNDPTQLNRFILQLSYGF
jgi:low affinity Fe/Cu permease